jgi:alkylated DNA nucleotide flippase Atl1
MQAFDRLHLISNIGIEGDVNAVVGSPRQVLMLDSRSLIEFRLQPGELRENIVFDRPVEDLKSGQLLQVGDALIRPTFACEPCAYLETVQLGLAEAIGKHRGMLGMVIRGGMISVGAAVSVTSHSLPSLPDTAKERFLEFVDRIPPGKIVTTQDLILALGVSKAHYRVIPTFIKKAPPGLPVHRIVAIDGRLLTKHLPNQAHQLSAEGVQVQGDRVGMGDRWAAIHFHRQATMDTPIRIVD